ncbi:transcription regulator protein BACH1-like isoform X1 [Arapaima gigas]
MSFESSRTSMFTFQSSVHSSHVLQCLNEQRQKDILCDVTVVVENKRFRAHRCVLASCSDYFQTQITNHVGHGLMITLPSEVTVEGFDPLLDFAYTAKLLFTKENILEIRNCANILGFRNLDKACFDFLIPKFFDSSKSTQTVYRKSRWKSRCCMEKPFENKSSYTLDDGEDNDNEEDEHKNNQSLDDLPKQKGDKAPCPDAKSHTDVWRSCTNACQEKSRKTDFSIPCRDYCRAPGEEQICCPGMSSKRSISPITPSASSDSKEQAGSNRDSDMAQVTGEKVVMVSGYLPCVPVLPGNSEPASFAESQRLDCGRPVGSRDVQREGCPLAPFDVCNLMSLPRLKSHYRPLHHIYACGLTQRDRQEDDRRSSVEREVAEHLARGFWPDFTLQADPFVASKCVNVPCLKPLQQDSGEEGHPLLPELGPVRREVSGYKASSLTESSPCVSALQSGEDSDFDTEGETESCGSERAREVQLPFSVEQIASLSRNDFQQLLKYHPLTQEQLDFVHDVRRRSKNRIAAQRCRKRKLDCIHNLECEIDKLKTEKEKLLQEQNLLNNLKFRTRQSLSDLCQQMCSEARLRPDQLQVLAKYSSPDCPLSVLLAQMPSHSSSPGLQDEAQEDPQSSSACSTTQPSSRPRQVSRGASGGPQAQFSISRRFGQEQNGRHRRCCCLPSDVNGHSFSSRKSVTRYQWAVFQNLRLKSNRYLSRWYGWVQRMGRPGLEGCQVFNTRRDTSSAQ